MTDSPEFLIADILPAREVHLIGGSSGSGKTTFLFQMLAEWQEGRPVLGHESFPVPYCYVSIDRSRSSVDRTLRRLDLQGRITRILCGDDLPSNANLSSTLEVVQDRYPDSRVLFIEGFQTLVGDKGNAYTPVATLLKAVTKFCAENGYTIIGVCHSPKLKTEEGFQHPREMLLGSVAWAAFSDTVFTMDMNEKTGIITLSVMPRNAAKEEHLLMFGQNGVLEPPYKSEPSPKDLLRRVALAQGYGSEITRRQVLEWGGELEASVRTSERVVAELIAEGELVQTMNKGIYKRVHPSIRPVAGEA